MEPQYWAILSWFALMYIVNMYDRRARRRWIGRLIHQGRVSAPKEGLFDRNSLYWGFPARLREPDPDPITEELRRRAVRATIAAPIIAIAVTVAGMAIIFAFDGPNQTKSIGL